MPRRCQLPSSARKGCTSPAAAPQGSAAGWCPHIPPKLPGELQWAEAERRSRVSTRIFPRRCKRIPEAVCYAPFTAVVLDLAQIWGHAELSLVHALRADSGQGGPRGRHWRAPGISAEGSTPPATAASLLSVWSGPKATGGLQQVGSPREMLQAGQPPGPRVPRRVARVCSLQRGGESTLLGIPDSAGSRGQNGTQGCFVQFSALLVDFGQGFSFHAWLFSSLGWI